MTVQALASNPVHATEDSTTPLQPAHPGVPLNLASDLVPITQIAAAAGITAARIAQWENRLGWPVAVRDARGRRRYPASLIPDLREAARRSDCGRSLRDDIRDGVPVWLMVQARPRQQSYNLTRCSNVPEPRTPEGIRLRGALLEALAEQDEASVRAVLARLPTIHPTDRDAAVMAVLRATDHPLAEGTSPSPVDAIAPEIPPLPSPEPVAADSSEPSADRPGAASHLVTATEAADVEPITTEPVTPAPEIAVTAVASPPAPAPLRRKPALSDETLGEWQAMLTRHARERRHQQEAIAARKARVEAFRHLRRVLKQLNRSVADPARHDLADDPLTVAVHEAPEKIRTVLAQVLSAMSSRHRSRRRQGR